jgi:methyltransferase (TIGR00027 family)
MKLPNLSYMMSVGELRYIQSQFEKVEDRNPDFAVGTFLPLAKRLRCLVRGVAFLSRARSDPFYYYVLARTKYYDKVFLDAICASFKCIVNIGCGSDTRAYRFAHLLKQKGVTALECDQGKAILAKQDIARRNWPTDHVKYVSIDLNDSDWPSFVEALDKNSNGRPVLAMMEGVSPYVSDGSFRSFLNLLATRLPPQSIVAYDFKLRGAADNFGSSQVGRPLFRLPKERQAVADYHRALGYELQHLELGSDLCRRLQPNANTSFKEDCLVRLVTTGSVNS